MNNKLDNQSKVIVVMPAYNAAQTLVDTFQSIPPDSVDHVILVDDGSIDDTAVVASHLNLQLIVHPHNAGYGANQKTCYMEALRQGIDRNDIATVQSAAHSLKSSSATLGAVVLAEQCNELEQMARAGGVASAPEYLAGIEAEYRAVRVALAAELEMGV